MVCYQWLVVNNEGSQRMNRDPFWAGFAVVTAVVAAMMPWGLNIILAAAAVAYWRMSREA